MSANKRMVNTGLHALVFRLRVIPALPLLDVYHREVLVTQNMLDVVGQSPMPFQLSSEVLISRKAILQFQNQPHSLQRSHQFSALCYYHRHWSGWSWYQHCLCPDRQKVSTTNWSGKRLMAIFAMSCCWQNAPVIMMNYIWLMKGSETILLQTLCVKEPDILHTMFLFSKGSVSLMMMRTCHVFAARRRSKKKVDCCTCGLLPGEWQTIRRDPSFPNWVVTNKL